MLRLRIVRFHRFRPIITSSQLAKGGVTRDNTWISAPSGGSVTRDRRTIRNGTVSAGILSLDHVIRLENVGSRLKIGCFIFHLLSKQEMGHKKFFLMATLSAFDSESAKLQQPTEI